jgi:hypothetical protein
LVGCRGRGGGVSPGIEDVHSHVSCQSFVSQRCGALGHSGSGGFCLTRR